MTAETTAVSLNAVAAALAAATPRLGGDEQRLAAVLLRLLSAGAPVTIAAAAAAAGMPRARAEPSLGDAAELARRHAARAFGAGSA